jgi:hypothetical protein
MVDSAPIIFRNTYGFSDEEKHRLEKFAAIFHVPVEHLPDGRIHLTVPCRTGQTSVELLPRYAYLRLLSEVCSLTARWLYFTPEVHCATTLFEQSDARVQRLAVLHKLWVDAGRAP